MSSLIRRFTWWLRQRHKEEELNEELQFHLEQEAEERRAAGLPEEEARWAARRDLGNDARVREDARELWTWRPLDELSQDLRYAFRTLFKNRAVTVFAVLSLALGIGANTAIYSFMDAILMRSLPIADPASLVDVMWRAKAQTSREDPFVLHSIDGSTYRYSGGVEARIFPFTAYEQLRNAAAPVMSSLFTYFSAGRLNVIVRGDAQLSAGEYVGGNFFAGLAVSPAAGRLLGEDDNRPGAPSVAVVSHGYSERRFGGAANAVGQQILINNTPFTVVGVTPPEFFGVDPAAAPSVYLPLQTEQLLTAGVARKYQDPNYYWVGMMGRLRPGVTIQQAEAALGTVFASWVVTTASEGERANLPSLRLEPGARGLDILRRRYSQPLYVLFGMVALILAIACANTANLLLARASARRREIAVRLSIGAGRFRLVRQLLTESIALSSIAGALGIVVAIAGVRLLTLLLANGDQAFTLHADLNWRVLAVTIALSVVCGIVFGLAPALQSTRPELVPALKDADGGLRHRPNPWNRWNPWNLWNLRNALVVGQIAVLMLLLVGAGLFAQTLSNLQSVPLGFNRENLLLFELNAPQAGYPQATAPRFYDGLRDRFAGIPGVRMVTLSHSSLIKAGRSHPVTVDGVAAEGTRFLQTGPKFFSAMQIPILQGREIDERDRNDSLPVMVVSDLFARRFLGGQNPIGRHVKVGGSAGAMDLEVVGVVADAHYGPLKFDIPPVVYVPYSQLPTRMIQQMVYALRTDGDPMRHVNTIRQIVHDADSRVPVTNVVTQAEEVDRVLNQEIVLARLCTSFAILALVIACVGLYGTMAYAVARRTREIGIRMALGAKRGAVTWMVMREVCVLAALGLVISIPIARGTSKFVESLLFQMKPNDPRAMTLALITLLIAAFVAAYGPARRASRIDPTTALRHE